MEIVIVIIVTEREKLPASLLLSTSSPDLLSLINIKNLKMAKKAEALALLYSDIKMNDFLKQYGIAEYK